MLLPSGGTIYGYPNDGYIVSIAPLGEISPNGHCVHYADGLEFEDVSTFFQFLTSRYETMYDSAGWWWDSEHRFYAVDGNVHVNDQFEAIELGKTFGQEAIWDVQNESPIYIEGC
jgi:hypothetical protein